MKFQSMWRCVGRLWPLSLFMGCPNNVWLVVFRRNHESQRLYIITSRFSVYIASLLPLAFVSVAVSVVSFI